MSFIVKMIKPQGVPQFHSNGSSQCRDWKNTEERPPGDTSPTNCLVIAERYSVLVRCFRISRKLVQSSVRGLDDLDTQTLI